MFLRKGTFAHSIQSATSLCALFSAQVLSACILTLSSCRNPFIDDEVEEDDDDGDEDEDDDDEQGGRRRAKKRQRNRSVSDEQKGDASGKNDS